MSTTNEHGAMRRDRLFERSESRASDFEFGENVAAVFDDMVSRSVPFYAEQQRMIQEIVKTAHLENGTVYDLGCSTATTLLNLCQESEGVALAVGYDNSPAMLEVGRRKVGACGLADRITLRYGDLERPDDLELPLAEVALLCWTLQFVRPVRRDQLIRWIYDSLAPGGMLVVTEKILARNGSMNKQFVDFYYGLKSRNGYSGTEIARKREALENVLVPYTIDENVELFRRNGFSTCETFFQWYNFAGFLCLKDG